MVAGREVTPKDAAATERLDAYWLTGPGSKLIEWNVPGDFNRCVALLGKYIHNENVLKGHCSNLHLRATGARPGHAASEQHKH